MSFKRTLIALVILGILIRNIFYFWILFTEGGICLRESNILISALELAIILVATLFLALFSMNELLKAIALYKK